MHAIIAITRRTRITPQSIERMNDLHRKARHPPIPKPQTIPDKRPAMIDRLVQQEIDDNDRKG